MQSQCTACSHNAQLRAQSQCTACRTFFGFGSHKKRQVANYKPVSMAYLLQLQKTSASMDVGDAHANTLTNTLTYSLNPPSSCLVFAPGDLGCRGRSCGLPCSSTCAVRCSLQGVSQFQVSHQILLLCDNLRFYDTIRRCS